jgi:protein-disulfide isomerase
VLSWSALPRYWAIQAGGGLVGLAAGRTPSGHPWIGAAEPLLEIEEYSDYQCPYCLRGHREMRDLIEAYPDKVRLVHRHYPLDQSCNPNVRRAMHPQACAYARMAFCAGEQDKFWEANDYLFTNGRRRQPVQTREIARALRIDRDRFAECLGSERARTAVAGDIAAGRALNVRGTPTFVVRDQLYPGRIPRDVLAEILGASGTADGG